MNDEILVETLCCRVSPGWQSFFSVEVLENSLRIRCPPRWPWILKLVLVKIHISCWHLNRNALYTSTAYATQVVARLRCTFDPALGNSVRVNLIHSFTVRNGWFYYQTILHYLAHLILVFLQQSCKHGTWFEISTKRQSTGTFNTSAVRKIHDYRQMSDSEMIQDLRHQLQCH